MLYAQLPIIFIVTVFTSLIATSGQAAEVNLVKNGKDTPDKKYDLIQTYSKEFDYEDFDFWAEQCRLLNQEEDHEKTLATCEQAISLKPGKDNTDLWEARSHALFNLRNYLEAIASYNRVLEVSPKSSISMAYQCAALFQLNRYDDAIDICEEALQVNGIWGKESPAIAWYYRGLSLKAVNRLETALESLIRAVTVDPNNEVALAGLCALESDLHLFQNEFPKGSDNRNDIDRRLNEIQQLANDSSGNSIGIFELFQNNLSDKEKKNHLICSLEMATKLYERALAVEPNNETLWLEQGLILEQLGKYEKALISYEKTNSLLPNYSLALGHKCAVLVQLEKYDPALEACELALQGDNNWGRKGENIGVAYGWTQKSAALIGLGQYEDALAAAERAIAIAPDYSVAWNNKAVSQWHLKKLQEALNSIQVAIHKSQNILSQYQDDIRIPGEAFELEYNEAPIFFHRSRIIALFNQGRILTSNSDFDEASKAYQQALTIHEDQEKSWGFSIIGDRLTANIHTNQATAYILKHSGGGCVGSISDLNNAITHAKEVLSIYPDMFTSWYTLGLAELYSCNFASAEMTFKEAIQRSPENIYAMTGLGIALARTNQKQQAIETFEKVLNLDSRHLLAQHCREYLVLITQPPSKENICTRWFI